MNPAYHFRVVLVGPWGVNLGGLVNSICRQKCSDFGSRLALDFQNLYLDIQGHLTLLDIFYTTIWEGKVMTPSRLRGSDIVIIVVPPEDPSPIEEVLTIVRRYNRTEIPILAVTVYEGKLKTKDFEGSRPWIRIKDWATWHDLLRITISNYINLS